MSKQIGWLISNGDLNVQARMIVCDNPAWVLTAVRQLAEDSGTEPDQVTINPVMERIDVASVMPGSMVSVPRNALISLCENVTVLYEDAPTDGVGVTAKKLADELLRYVKPVIDRPALKEAFWSAQEPDQNAYSGTIEALLDALTDEQLVEFVSARVDDRPGVVEDGDGDLA